MPTPPTERELEQRKAAAESSLWRKGILAPWKLHRSQLEVYWAILASKAARFVLEIARRWGKTHLLVVIALETCLRFPGCRVVYGAPTLKHLNEFIMPVFEGLIENAPLDCRPTFNASSGHWKFPEDGPARGSYVHLFGADDKRKANRGRGPEAKLCIFDEAGFSPILGYVLRSIFRPQLLLSGGMTLLGSTPSEEPDHDFTSIAERAEAQGNYASRTIHDNPRLSAERIAQFIAEDAAEEGMTPEEYQRSDDFRREYLAERVVNKMLVVVPEWEEARKTLIRPVPRPEYFRGHVSLDFGGADPHAALFGYWHPHVKTKVGLGAVVVEDELLLHDDQNTQEIAEAVKGKESALWGVNRWEGTLAGTLEADLEELRQQVPEWMADVLSASAPTQPWVRVADNNLQLIRDLYELHRLVFVPTGKDHKALQVNNLRVAIREGAFVADPRCIELDRHLRTTTWKDHKRKDFSRRGGEHGDLVDCAVYKLRNIDRRNPAPQEIELDAQAPFGKRGKMREAAQSGSLTDIYLGHSRIGRRLVGRR